MQFRLLAFLSAALALTLANSCSAAQVTQAGIDLIEQFEGYRANFYTDPTGHRTICYGYNCDANSCSHLQPPLSKAQCTDLLKQTLPQYERCACAMKGMDKANANQFSAMVDFAYNAGCGGLQSTWPTAIEEGNWVGIASALPHVITNGGLLGLVNRRKAEAKLILTPTNARSGC